MNIVASVFGTVKEMYRGLNPATLTGGIDVIVVRQPDGSFHCSPFHVRFGKLGVLRSSEKVVDIEINGEPVDLHMKLGDNGEAFFVEEHEDLESEVPAHLCTSPIPLEVAEEKEENLDGSSTTGGSGRKKKRRRKRIRSETHLREEAYSSSDEREQEKESERESDQTGHESPTNDESGISLQLSKSIYYSISEEPNEQLGATQTRDSHPLSDGEQSFSESVFYSRPSSPKSDSELYVKPQGSSGPQMQWNWGGFPTPCQSDGTPVHVSSSGSSHFRTIERQDSFDMEFEPVISCGRVGSVTVVRPKPRTHSPDFNNSFTQTAPSSTKKAPHIELNNPPESSTSPFETDNTQLEFPLDQESVLRNDTGSTVNNIHDTDSIDHVSIRAHKPTSGNTVSFVSVTKPALNTEDESYQIKQNTFNSSNAVSTESTHPQEEEALLEQNGHITNTAQKSEEDNGIDICINEEKDNKQKLNHKTLNNNSAAKTEVKDAGTSCPVEEELSNTSMTLNDTASKTEQHDTKKGKRSHHLGKTDIYLDQLTSMDPEVAALYFPKSGKDGSSLHGTEQGFVSGSQSPQSVSSGALDSGTEYLSDSMSYNVDVSMSLCGPEGNTSHITKEKFMARSVSYQDFSNNPGIIDDPRLVICINSNYYNWAVAAPMVLSMAAFQKNLPKSTIEQLVKDKMSKRSGRWWFPFRRRDMTNSQKNSKEDQDEQLSTVPSKIKATLDDVDSDEVAGLGRYATLSSSLSTDTLNTAQCISQMYRKSLRLTSKQIEQLNLCEGENKVVFSVTTQYQGTCRCEASIYLWNWDDRVIISDIDGTITKSDALGHILPQFGKDWTHSGIAKLYHKIHQNGYKFLYCSARAIGMSTITKDYLCWVNDKGTVLPKGPVLLAPSSLFSALHREVIEKKPEVFKVACLSDIRDLFLPQKQPFYAAFGNRTNDAYAYKQVGVPETKIFTVNPKGELVQEKTKANKSSYNHLCELVEHFFPMLSAESSALDCPDFSSVSFWKDPFPPVDLEGFM